MHKTLQKLYTNVSEAMHEWRNGYANMVQRLFRNVAEDMHQCCHIYSHFCFVLYVLHVFKKVEILDTLFVLSHRILNNSESRAEKQFVSKWTTIAL